MTPEQFIATWKNNKLSERGGAQGHFDDLCDLLGVTKPRDPENYCFERGAKKSGGGDGWPMSGSAASTPPPAPRLAPTTPIPAPSPS